MELPQRSAHSPVPESSGKLHVRLLHTSSKDDSTAIRALDTFELTLFSDNPAAGGQAPLVSNETNVLHTYGGQLSPIPEEDAIDQNASSSHGETVATTVTSASCCSTPEVSLEEDKEDTPDTVHGLRTNWLNVLRFFIRKRTLFPCCRPRVEDR